MKRVDAIPANAERCLTTEYSCRCHAPKYPGLGDNTHYEFFYVFNPMGSDEFYALDRVDHAAYRLNEDYVNLVLQFSERIKRFERLEPIKNWGKYIGLYPNSFQVERFKINGRVVCYRHSPSVFLIES